MAAQRSIIERGNRSLYLQGLRRIQDVGFLRERSLCVGRFDEVTEDHFDKIFNHMDVNGDGVINFAEFVKDHEFLETLFGEE